MLAGAAGLAAAAGLPAFRGPAYAAPTITDLGPASSVLTFGNGTLIGDTLWMATRQVVPTKVAGYDLTTGAVTATAKIPGVAGCWGAASIGTDLYVGTYTPGGVFRIDTRTLTVEQVIDPGTEVIWTLRASPDGKIYAGTYLGARLWEYDPATGRSTDLGRMHETEEYVRDLEVTDTHVYACIGSAAHLIAYDRATRTKTEIMPPELADQTFAATAAIVGDHLIVGFSPTSQILVADLADHGRTQILKTPNESFVMAITGTGKDVWFTTRPSGSLYHFTIGDTEPELVTVPIPEASTLRMGMLPDGKLWLVQANQSLIVDPATKEVEVFDLASPDLEPSPERPMSLAYGDGRLFVGGSAGVQVTAADGSSTDRISLGGEAKDFDIVDHVVHAGVYTLARIYRMPTDGETFTEVARVAADQEQTRAHCVVVDRRSGLVHLGTEPDYGKWEGALSTLDPSTGELRTWRGVIPDQSIHSIAVVPGGLYLGGDVINGFGTQPKAERASLAFFNPASGRLAWTMDPLPDAKRIFDLHPIGRHLVGMSSTGTLFCVDPARRKTLWQLSTGTVGGRLAVLGDTVHGSNSDALWSARIGPNQPSLTMHATGLAQSWFGPTEVATDGRDLYTTKGLNLIKVSL